MQGRNAQLAAETAKLAENPPDISTIGVAREEKHLADLRFRICLARTNASQLICNQLSSCKFFQLRLSGLTDLYCFCPVEECLLILGLILDGRSEIDDPKGIFPLTANG